MIKLCYACKYYRDDKCVCEVSPYYELDKITVEQLECTCDEYELGDGRNI